MLRIMVMCGFHENLVMNALHTYAEDGITHMMVATHVADFTDAPTDAASIKDEDTKKQAGTYGEYQDFFAPRFPRAVARTYLARSAGAKKGNSEKSGKLFNYLRSDEPSRALFDAARQHEWNN